MPRPTAPGTISRAFRVLVDLSYASLGYCGMAQESRAMLSSFSRLGRVAPTGLIYDRHDSVVRHRFVKSSDLAQRAENHALFIQACIDHVAPRSCFRIVRTIQNMLELFRIGFGRSVQTDLLDNEVHWDTIWRNHLSKSLLPDEIEIARKCPMLLANLGGRMLAARAVYNTPAPKLNTRGFDFAVFHDSQAIRLSKGTTKIVRYYDLIPGVRPDLVGSRQCIQNHFRAIRRCLHDSVYVCISKPTQDDLLRAFPELRERCVTIPCALPSGYYPERFPEFLPAIIRSRISEATKGKATHKSLLNCKKMPPYIIISSTVEPRKNHVTLIRAFERLIAHHDTDLRLMVVGNLGWKYDEAVRAMKPLIEKGRLFHLENVPVQELRILYTHAQALVFPSLYEGFGYTPLEAMCCHTPAVVSDIAAHRWVYEDAALYFDPYNPESLNGALESLLYSADNALREELVARGDALVERYRIPAVSAQWLRLFDVIHQQKTEGRLDDLHLSDIDLTEKTDAKPAVRQILQAA